MSKAKAIFTLDGDKLAIQCKTNDKMRDICQNFSTKINKDMNSLLFLYGGNLVNFELSFNSQASKIDRDKQEMKILVYNNEQENFICPKCGEKIKLNKEKIDELISSNNEIEETINGIKLRIENIIKIYPNNSMNIQLKNINKMLSMVNEDINKNNNKIKNLLNVVSNHNNKIINNNINDNNKVKNIDVKKGEKNNKLNSNNNNDNNNNNISLNTNNIKERNHSFNKKNNLLKNIKSTDVFENLFSCLNEKIKLKTIKYNKHLQGNININLINYKFFSEKYIIYEKNGKGKEYSGYSDDLEFEGEYLNGQRNGKGKEFYSNGKLKFEGEYLKGQSLNGKGKEYFILMVNENM